MLKGVIGISQGEGQVLFVSMCKVLMLKGVCIAKDQKLLLMEVFGILIGKGNHKHLGEAVVVWIGQVLVKKGVYNKKGKEEFLLKDVLFVLIGKGDHNMDEVQFGLGIGKVFMLKGVYKDFYLLKLGPRRPQLHHPRQLLLPRGVCVGLLLKDVLGILMGRSLFKGVLVFLMGSVVLLG